MTHQDHTESATPQAAVPWTSIAIFVSVSLGLAWLVAMPLWLGDGLASPLVSLVLPAMMTTPAIAALLVVFVFQRPRPASRAQFLGLVPVRPGKRTFAMLGIGFAAGFVIPVIAVLAAALTGQVKLDLVEFSALQATLDAQASAAGTEPAPLPIEVIVAAQLLSIPMGAFFNSFLAFGEELGWRGWLISALRPLGVWPTLLISGAIWGVWHAPLILLGYNFAEPNALGLIVMIVGCIAVGIIFGWLRLRSGNVWPAVLAHGTFNAAAGLTILVSAAEPVPSALALSPLSWPGWIACAVVIAILIINAQLRPQRLQRTLPPAPRT